MNNDPARTDPDQDADVRVLDLVCWSLMVAVVLMGLTMTALLPEHILRWLGLVCAQVAVAVAAMVLARAGRRRAAALFLVVSLWALVTFAASTTGGVAAPIMVGFAVFAAVAGLLLGWRGGVAAAVASVVTVLGLATAEAAGVLPAPEVGHTLWSAGVLVAVYVGLSGVLVALATFYLRRAREQAEHELRERRAVEGELRARNAELDALLRASRAPASSLDYHEVLPEVARAAGEALGSPECLIWEFVPATRRMVCRCLWQRQPVPGVAEGQEGVSFDAALVSLGLDSLLSGEVLQVHAGDPRLSERDRASLDRQGDKSCLRVPLVTERGLFGVMYLLETEREREFTDGEMRLASAVGEQAAVALENARLYTERKEAEEQLALLNAELERRVELRTAQLRTANEEMEAFAYSVSHDLRGPLRAIDGFSALVLEDAADRLDADDRDSLARVRAAAQRMDQLIDALLTLSRLSRKSLELERVDLGAMAAGVVEQLREQMRDRDVEVRIALGPAVTTDAGLAEVVLTNLIGNAWKFTSANDVAHIEVGETLAEGERVFFVRDDGAGFDAAYAGQLFQPFQRLHGAGEFPGTGIGLATVRRIVTRLGGSCWADGAVGEGATFSFTLPDLDA